MNDPIISYKNDPALKARFVGHVEKHREMDMVAQGHYGKLTRGGEWKGCAVACSLRSLDEIEGLPLKEENRSHADLAKRLGIPLVLAYLEDRIFEGLSAADSLTWPARFARAIPVGKDLSLVWAGFAAWLLTDPDSGVRRHAKTDRTRDSIDVVANLYKRELAGDKPTLETWREARRNASGADAAAAAYAADADADAAAAAAAAGAAYAAGAAADAAYAAAYAYAYAADADARLRSRQAWFLAASNKLCELLEAA